MKSNDKLRLVFNGYLRYFRLSIALSLMALVMGSMLIIGSAAGVAVMGIERIDFIWYLKKISLLAIVGYFAGAAVYIMMN